MYSGVQKLLTTISSNKLGGGAAPRMACVVIITTVPWLWMFFLLAFFSLSWTLLFMQSF